MKINIKVCRYTTSMHQWTWEWVNLKGLRQVGMDKMRWQCVDNHGCWLLKYPTRKPSWRKGYTWQHHHSKMAASYHLGFFQTGNSAIRSADPENHNQELNLEWIGCIVCEIFAFKLYCDLEIGVRGHSRSSKVALFDRAHTTLYSSSIVTMPLSITVSRYSRILVENCHPPCIWRPHWG